MWGRKNKFEKAALTSTGTAAFIHSLKIIYEENRNSAR
jgi:hypothetical protein